MRQSNFAERVRQEKQAKADDTMPDRQGYTFFELKRPGRSLLNSAANLREHVVGIRADETNRAYDNHQNHG